MDNSNNTLDNQYLLNIPISYLLETKKVKDIEQDFDSNGWNLMHYSVADANIPKITELIHFSFDWSVNGNKNYIPLSIYNINEKKKIQKNRLSDKIPFCKSGFSPVHLAMFLYNHYNNLSDEFFYQQLSEKYMKIISLFVNDSTDFNSYIDKEGHSLFDYAFLLEDVSLIDKLHMIDSNFSSLNKVHPTLAKQIIEVMAIKNTDNEYSNLINLLSKKILSDSLSLNLKTKENSKNSIKKI